MRLRRETQVNATRNHKSTMKNKFWDEGPAQLICTQQRDGKGVEWRQGAEGAEGADTGLLLLFLGGVAELCAALRSASKIC